MHTRAAVLESASAAGNLAKQPVSNKAVPCCHTYNVHADTCVATTLTPPAVLRGAVYYWILLGLYVFSPQLAYNFSELIEAHAVDTYGGCRVHTVRRHLTYGAQGICLRHVLHRT